MHNMGIYYSQCSVSALFANTECLFSLPAYVCIGNRPGHVGRYPLPHETDTKRDRLYTSSAYFDIWFHSVCVGTLVCKKYLREEPVNWQIQ